MSSDSRKFCAKCIYYYGSTHVNWNTNDREYINTCKRKSDKVNIVTGEYPVRGTDCNIERSFLGGIFGLCGPSGKFFVERPTVKLNPPGKE